MVVPRQLRMTPPGVSVGLIERPRLATLMEARPVTVLAGVAGYGKSTLLAAAAERRPPGGTVWLTLDDTDKDPVRFVGDLLTATTLAGIEPLSDQVEQLRVSSLRAEPLSLVDSLLEALYDSAQPHLLVLDDLQHLAGSVASTTIVDHLLRWAPANLRISMAARVVPPLRLQRLRLEDRLTYLAHDDLAFSLEESTAAVRAAQLDLDLTTVTAIQQATDGWPAGVRMAILAARHRGTATDVSVELRRDQALADYLATEVLASLAPDLRNFVLEASLDEQVCPSLVDAVRGTCTAEALLESCVSAGLFLSRGVPGTHGQWYQWHPLFAAHTQRRLAADHPSLASRLHASAASWWSSVDAPTAIGHALAAGDGEAASRIFSESWLELLLQGRVDAVLSAVDRLPHVSAYRGDAHLAKALVSVQRGETGLARAELDAARISAGTLSEVERTRLEQRTALVELLVTGCDLGLGEAARAGVAMLEELADARTGLDPVVMASVQVLVGMGEARVQQHVETALDLLRTAARTAGTAGLSALELTALAESCIPAITEGQLTEAHDRAVDVLAKAEANGWVGLTTLAPAVVYLGWLDYWRGNLHEARAQLQRSLSMLFPFDWELRGLALHFHAKTCLALGDLAAARASMTQIAALIDAGGAPAWWPRMLAAIEGLLLWAEHEPGRAVELALDPPSGPDYPAAPALRATVLLRAGRPVEALSQLECADSSDAPIQVECLSRCVEAEALAVLGKEDAHLALEKALAAAEPDGLFRPFLAGGAELTALLREHLSHGTSHPEVVTQVLARLADPAQHHTTIWSEQLTEREHVILRYLATNLTNTEIADAEFISVHTAKTHIAHIYRKLGVNNRRSAIRRAAELDLY
ncbi:LuxR C-terminal-related transcriptional regulator [Humibacillus xanthopallidus]|uniref:LuxR family maltose regulon positive regulatory protein n=1 Tax=Humibacillus xanthopallidus TaxID=412689 RepID=A0A543HI13_9MICO|nr:LuxR C-terminal-related transcriptional regulator [Humibacillus xanthopallidus]TQM57966.1 LuxR family maltose regulon positive regulatory protein [Humibacillus xanthopallidus]